MFYSLTTIRIPTWLYAYPLPHLGRDGSSRIRATDSSNSGVGAAPSLLRLGHRSRVKNSPLRLKCESKLAISELEQAVPPSRTRCLTEASMKLTRVSAQSKYALHDEFATDECDGEGKRLAFAATQQLLDRLNDVDGPSLYVYTSLFRLCFVNGDDYRLPTITRCTPYYHTTE